MGELRKDYVLDRYVIISDKRGNRPYEFDKEQKLNKIEDKNKSNDKNNNNNNNNINCSFCPGNEHLTTKEIVRIEKNVNKENKNMIWEMRVIPNKFPVIELKREAKIKKKDNLYFSSNYGVHEVVVETNNHNEQIVDYSAEHLFELLQLYKQRYETLQKIKNIKYVQIIKNHGKDAGASIKHAHSQIFAYGLIPTVIQQKEKACANECVYCKIIAKEMKSERRCFENDNFAAFTPYASRFAYEIWVFSKKHKKSLQEFSDIELKDLALMMKLIFEKLKELNADFNFYFQQGVDNMHFHIEFAPRINHFAGFELATDCVINTIFPEDAARWYGGW